MKKAVIIGASSGIGARLAGLLAEDGYTLGLVARRVHLLEELARSLPSRCFVRGIDVSAVPEAMEAFDGLLAEMGGVDLAIISAGTGFINPDLDWITEKETIDTNVTGFAAMANVAFRHFLAKGSGHLVAVSSIAALRGSGQAPAYNASKAFISNYMQGLRQKAAKAGAPILITDIRPGLVDTAMAKGDGLFWIQRRFSPSGPASGTRDSAGGNEKSLHCIGNLCSLYNSNTAYVHKKSEKNCAKLVKPSMAVNPVT